MAITTLFDFLKKKVNPFLKTTPNVSKETITDVLPALVPKMKHPYHATILVMIISFIMTKLRLTIVLLFVNIATVAFIE